jgi:hypothetical protein
MSTRRQRTLPAFAAAVVLAGCGIADPYTHPARARPPAPTTAARTSSQTITDPSEPPPSRSTTVAAGGVTAAPSTHGAATARQAVALYTRLYINWTATTLGAHQRRLAAISEGTARAAALQAAASYGRDRLLDSSHVTNAGTIIAIAAGQGPERGDWVIVTSEHTTGHGDYAGLPAAAHVTYAQATHTPTGWVISQWSPQN